MVKTVFLALVLLFSLPAVSQEILEDPETGEQLIQSDNGNNAGGNIKNCYDIHGKPKKCPPEVVNVPFDSWPLLAVFFIFIVLAKHYPKNQEKENANLSK